MQPKHETPDLPEPVDGEDFYIDELQTHTVSITVAVGGMKERDSDEDMCLKAVTGLRDGSLDGDATIMWSEKVRDVELAFETDLLFDRTAWKRAKWRELGFNENGEPLRPGEKIRPPCEATLADFMQRQYSFGWIATRVNVWLRRCWRTFQGAV